MRLAPLSCLLTIAFVLWCGTTLADDADDSSDGFGLPLEPPSETPADPAPVGASTSSRSDPPLPAPVSPDPGSTNRTGAPVGEFAEPLAKSGPTPEMARATKAVVAIVARHHYSRHPLDSELARRTLVNFLSRLDPMKMSLRRSDVDRFQRKASRLREDLLAGDVSLAFDVFLTYVERLGEMMPVIDFWLEAEHDFTVDEEIVISDESIDYVDDSADARERWRKRIKYELLFLKSGGKSLDEARRQLAQRFHGTNRRLRQNTPEEVFGVFMTSLVASYDPQSSYLSAIDYENQQISIKRQLVGIGASLAVVDDFVTVKSLVPGGPAARDGQLQPGDRIIAVGQGAAGDLVSVMGQGLADVVKVIRGQKGTQVRLRVISEGEFESQVLTLTRDKIDLARMGSAVLEKDQLPGERDAAVGYVYLPSFYVDLVALKAGKSDYRSVSRDLRPLLDDFKTRNVDVVVVDLRQNSGGSLPETINTAGLFFGNRTVVQVRDGDARVNAYAAQDIKQVWDGPLVVLTSRYTSGGAEILAGAIMDHKQGLIVGDPATNGAGIVRNIIDIGATQFGAKNPPKLGYLLLTIQKFYLPGGAGIQQRGVLPHVVLPSVRSLPQKAAASDRYQLKYDTIKAVDLKPGNYPVSDGWKQTLSDLSSRRRADSQWFAALQQRLPAIQAERDATHRTLNEAQFLATRRSLNVDQQWPSVPGIPDVSLTPYLEEALAVSLDYTSLLALSEAKKQYSARQFQSAIKTLHRAIGQSPSNGDAKYQLAWYLATCPQKELRNGQEAVRLAKGICEQGEWQKWTHILALALADAEAGLFEDALGHLDQALDLAPESSRAQYRKLEERFRQRRTF